MWMGPYFDLKTCTWLAGYLPSTPLGEAPLKSLCSWNWPSPQPPCSDAGHRHPLLCQHSPPGDFEIEKEWLTLVASEPTFLAFKVSPDASRQFSVLPLLFSYFVRMLMENLKSPIKMLISPIWKAPTWEWTSRNIRSQWKGSSSMLSPSHRRCGEQRTSTNQASC